MPGGQDLPRIRKTLTIGKVEVPKPIGDKGNLKLEFQASEPGQNGAFCKWETWKPELFDIIKEGAVLDCETQTEESGNFIHRKVQQIFQDGKPMGQRQGGGGNRGGGPTIIQDTPEKLLSEERRVGAGILRDLIIQGIYEKDDIAVQGLHQWLKGLFPLQTSAGAVKTGTVPSAARPPATQATTGKDPNDPDGIFEEKKKEEPPVVFANLGEFLTKANAELKMKPSDIAAVLQIPDCKAIKDWSAAWKTLKSKAKPQTR